ncbi:fatty acid desaturase [Ruegeria marina]|uniref:Fatty acid desaturase n=1 Tax=Ruegeria marina TaxID=639004 RepID=A0A1G6JP21_9RHOB|nr:fatty acid desaturase [Ruegeria marina]SDC20447.1 Fatty acid desaturase [Ruegeria marina]
MDHRTLVASLPPETRAELLACSDAAGLKHLALYGTLLGLTSLGILLRVPLWPLLVVPQGVLLVFLFTLCHECTHKTPFRSAWLNEVAGHVSGGLIALPFIWFRYFHLAHHKWTNDPQRDPELAGKPRPGNRRDLALYLSGWPYWSGMAKVLSANARGRFDAPYLPERQHPAMRHEARVLLALYALALASLAISPLVLWLWIVPLVIGQPFLRLYLLAEHGLCPPVADMLENSRTTFTTRLVRFLAWNMPYHAEHHAYPAVPFYRLPALHCWTRTHLKNTSDGYAAFAAQYLAQLKD